MGSGVADFVDPEESIPVDLGALLSATTRLVRLASPCWLSVEEPRASLALVRLLREAQSFGVPVDWQLRADESVALEPFVHLAPPRSVTDTVLDAARVAWQERHEPGLCYYRLGPGFVFVKDVRRANASARYKIEGVGDLRVLEGVADVAGLDRETRELLADLEAADLAVRLGGWATLVPCRMRRWPVPAHEV